MDRAAEAVFASFVRDRSPFLLRTAFLLTGDQGEAEDVVQEALRRVYVAWPRIEHRQAVESYTRKAVLREVLTRRRRRRVVHLLASSVADLVGVEVAGREGRDLVVQDELHRALLALPARQRAVLVLRFFEDLPERQVAQALGISVVSVKQHTVRGLVRLRVLLPGTAEPEVLR